MEALRKAKTIAIISNGALGIHLAGKISLLQRSLMRFLLPDIHSLLLGELAQSYQKKKIMLVTENDRLLPDSPEEVGPIAVEFLKQKGVDVLLQHKVTQVEEDRSEVDGSEESTVICETPSGQQLLRVDRYIVMGDKLSFTPYMEKYYKDCIGANGQLNVRLPTSRTFLI